MGTKRNYSITKDKYRFNDDFLLNLKFVVVEHNFAEFNSDSDWTFLVYAQLNENNTLKLLNTRTVVPSVLNPYGIIFSFSNTNITFGYLNKTTGLSENATVSHNFATGTLYNLAFVFDSVSKELNFIVNSRKIGAVTITEPFNLAGEIEHIRDGKINFGNVDISIIPIVEMSVRNYIALSEKASYSEINYTYQTGNFDKPVKDNLILSTPFNIIPNSILKRGGFIRKTNTTTGYNGFGAVFNTVLNVGDVVSYETTYNSFSNADFDVRWILGFKNLTDLNVPILGNTYLMNAQLAINQLVFVKSGVVDGSAIPNLIKGDIISFTLTTSTTIEVRRNATLLHTFTGVNSTNLRPFIQFYDAMSSPIKNLKYNNVLMGLGDVVTENGTNLLNRSTQDLAYINNPLTSRKQVNYIEYGGDELGLNAGTSTFTVYRDFYTKNNSENFSGGGDSINYKSKELRKYGIRLDGTQYFSILNLNQFDINKGLTILVGIADIDLTGSSKEFIHLTDSNTNRVITFEYDDISTNVLFKSGDVTQDTQSIAVDKTASNFAVYRVSQDVNKYSNGGLFRKSSNINTGENTLTNQSLNRTDATYNIYLGSGNGGSSPLNCVITYFALFEGILNDAEIKAYFNNGIFSNVADLSQTTKSTLIVAADFNNPFDDLGVLKIPDLSLNNQEILVNGFANITDLENAKEEILTLI